MSRSSQIKSKSTLTSLLMPSVPMSPGMFLARASSGAPSGNQAMKYSSILPSGRGHCDLYYYISDSIVSAFRFKPAGWFALYLSDSIVKALNLQGDVLCVQDRLDLSDRGGSWGERIVCRCTLYSVQCTAVYNIPIIGLFFYQLFA